MRVIGALRVKNEARWIERCIASITPLCTSGVVVLDDHSTDDTATLAAAAGAQVILSPFEGLQESRDKNYLLDLVRPRADWVVMIDGDEVLTDAADVALAQAMNWTYECISLPILYLWDREDQVRMDGVYGDFRRESIFRPRNYRFDEGRGRPGFHCGNVPRGCRQHRAYVDVPLLHFGYMHREDRERKFDWYNERDPENAVEDGYRHMVVGDIYPAESKFRYGGPLKLRELTSPASAIADQKEGKSAAGDIAG